MYTINPLGDGRFTIVSQSGDEWVWPDDDIPTEVLQSVLHEINAAIVDSADVASSAEAESRGGDPYTSADRSSYLGGGTGRFGRVTGMDLFNHNFKDWSPTGWGAGGWTPYHEMKSNMTGQQYGQFFTDNWRSNRGLDTLYHEGGPGGRWNSPIRGQMGFERPAETAPENNNMHGWDDNQQSAYDNLSDIRKKLVDWRKSR